MKFMLAQPTFIKPEIFYLVEFASLRQPGFRNRIVPVKHVPSFLQRYRNYECYTTYLLFTESIRQYLENQKSNGACKVSVSCYQGKANACYLPIDIDSKDLLRAQYTARNMIKFLCSELGANSKSVLAYFSGSAGFHLMIDKRIFGKVEPSENLHVTFSILREKLAEKSHADKDTVDFSIKDKMRLWRVPCTINQKSGLYKIQLTLEEVFALSPDQIKRKAKNPQLLFYTDRAGLIPVGTFIKPHPKAKFLYEEAVEITKKRTSAVNITIINYEKRNEEIHKINDTFCKAEQFMAANSIPKGFRNNTAMRLVSKLRRKGLIWEKAEEFIIKWNFDCNIRLPGYELMSIVRSVYSRPFCYNYGCNDGILKRFCPYQNRNECRNYKIFKAKKQHEKNKAKNKNEETKKTKKTTTSHNLAGSTYEEAGI
ncbi:MAG: hypothetical protein PVH61_39740 [Candidatus Aminicenantes bacterium]|jgi:hypothetical protein